MSLRLGFINWDHIWHNSGLIVKAPIRACWGEWMPALLHTTLPVPGHGWYIHNLPSGLGITFPLWSLPWLLPICPPPVGDSFLCAPSAVPLLLVFISRCHLKLLTYFRYFTRHVSLMAEAYSSMGPQDERLADAWWVHNPFIKQCHLLHGVGRESTSEVIFFSGFYFHVHPFHSLIMAWENSELLSHFWLSHVQSC